MVFDGGWERPSWAHSFAPLLDDTDHIFVDAVEQFWAGIHRSADDFHSRCSFSVRQSVASLLLLLMFNSVQPFSSRDESAEFYNLILCSMCQIAQQTTVGNSEPQPWCASSYSGFRKQTDIDASLLSYISAVCSFLISLYNDTCQSGRKPLQDW